MRFALLAALLAIAAEAADGTGSSGTAQQKRLGEVAALVPAGFTVLVEPPFIVAGDEPADQVRLRARNTVRWARDRLKQDFFPRDPDEVITIWLFKDKDSYETNARRLFRETPHTPYGYYAPRHRALIMNIATGGGTLVHEMVHGFMSANFPACPAWFNEGLGALFEQSEDRTGHIRGLPNWRLPGLQAAIRNGQTIPFERLTALSDTEFYSAPVGYNQYYAQARYLCYYLQEQGLLIKYYQEFRAHADTDPTGFASLKKILGTNDLVEFQKRWESFVLTLRFP